MSIYKVTSSSLNLRSEPVVSGYNRVAVLPEGHTVKKVNEDNDPWWHVETEFRGETLKGYVHSAYLINENEYSTNSSSSIIEVHLAENRSSIKRSRDGGRAYPLGEPNRPTRNESSNAGKVRQLGEVINWLKVDSSVRYARKGNTTYCNIYAYDYCYLANVYIPRVWWKPKAIIDLSNGKNVDVQYGNTVTEYNANSIHDWFEDFGSDFGWKSTSSITRSQDAANQGKIVIVCAKRVTTNRPGHICPIVPETSQHKAKRSQNGSVIRPLQSQAGSNNYRYKAANRWWKASRFQSFGIWIHD